MALVTRVSTASLDASSGMFAPQRNGNLYAGEALDAVAACYIKSSDGLVYMSNGTAADEASKFDGITPQSYAVGAPVTLFGLGAKFRYGSGLTAGADLYIGATAGRLDLAPTTGGSVPIARVEHNGVTIRIVRDTEGGGAGGVIDASNIVGGATVLHRIDLAAGALADTDVVLTNKTRVIDAFLILRGAGVATTTLQVKNGASAITNAMAASGSDQALVRAATIDDAAWEIAAGGTLRVTSATGASQPAATVYVIGHRVA